MIVGLHDADGSWENNLSPRVGESYGLVEKISFSQKTANSDVIDKVYKAIGKDSNVTYSVRAERRDSSGGEIKESKGVFNTTSPEGQALLAIFEKNPPLAPGKLRDYLIFLKITGTRRPQTSSRTTSLGRLVELASQRRPTFFEEKCLALTF